MKKKKKPPGTFSLQLGSDFDDNTVEIDFSSVSRMKELKRLQAALKKYLEYWEPK